MINECLKPRGKIVVERDNVPTTIMFAREARSSRPVQRCGCASSTIGCKEKRTAVKCLLLVREALANFAPRPPNAPGALNCEAAFARTIVHVTPCTLTRKQ
jgi:hypothetical protein